MKYHSVLVAEPAETLFQMLILNVVYPVGSVFMTTDSTQQPGTLYDGTTWESITSSISDVYMWKRTA